MKRAMLTIAGAVGLALGAVGPAATPADAHVWVGYGFGYGYGLGYSYPAYPNNYYPNYYYPHEYYTPHAPHYYPYYYPYYYTYPGYLDCYTIIHSRVYWKHGKKYLVQVPVRSCHHVGAY